MLVRVDMIIEETNTTWQEIKPQLWDMVKKIKKNYKCGAASVTMVEGKRSEFIYL